jgi:hypothetical protein
MRFIKGNFSGPLSQEVSTLCPGLLQVPSFSAAQGTTGQIDLTWTAVNGATSYDLFYESATTPPVTTPTTGSSTTNVAGPTSHSFNCTSNDEYRFAIRAKNASYTSVIKLDGSGVSGTTCP